MSPVRDAREDRLTEIWAAVFDSDHCAGFARHVVVDWLSRAARDPSVADDGRRRFGELAEILQQDGDWRCHVETQVPATLEEERRRPNLELTFTGPSSVSIWVEVKNGTAPHDGQLGAYCRIQRHQGLSHAAVVLVAPRGDLALFDPDELPSEVPRRTWEETARCIRTFARDGDSAVRRFLLDELWTYMQEEQLTDPERLTAAHVAALEGYPDARRALERLCDVAAERLGQMWGGGVGVGGRGTYPQRGDPRQYWWPHQPDDAGPLAAPLWWWDWKLLMDGTDILRDGEHRPAVFVGATGRTGAIGSLDDGVRQSLQNAGFDLLGPGVANGSQDYVVKHEYLGGQLVGEGPLGEQAETLARWLDGWFRKLQDAVRAGR